jgi:glycosyltransferase involved in cell wall biosynthesis
MKLLHVMADLARGTGGPSKAVVDMALAVRQLGHEVSIFATDFGGQSVSLEAARAAGIDIRLFPVCFPQFWKRSPRLKEALAGAIPACDLVLIHSLYLYHCWVAADLCRRHAVPYIVRPHGTLDPYLYRRRRMRKSVMEVMFQNRVLQDAAAIHYTSDEERRLAEPFARNASAEVVPLGLSEQDYRPLPPRGEFRSSFPETVGRTLVLFLGRLNFKKGLDLLLPAFAAAFKARSDLHLVLAGHDDDMGAKLAAMIESLQLQGRVTLTGFLAGRRKLASLVDAGMFVLPSYSENFGISVVEAMFCGVPVIVSDRVNICGDVAQAKAGRVISPSVDELSAAIVELAGSTELRRRLGAAGEELVRARFLQDRVGALLEQMYRRHARRRCSSHARPQTATVVTGPSDMRHVRRQADE